MSLALIEVAIEPKRPHSFEEASKALAGLVASDPALTMRSDDENGQLLLQGQDEFQLDVVLGRLIEQVPVLIGAPQVCYLETITTPANVDETYSRVHGPKGSFARVSLMFEPAARGAGFSFGNAASSDAVPAEYLVGVVRGLEAARQQGLKAGFPVTDFTATLKGGASHDVDSSINAFEFASRRAFERLRELGNPILLEPVMRVETSCPGAATTVRNDNVARRGVIIEASGEVVVALVPLSNLFGYRGFVRGLPSEVSYTTAFASYEPIPSDTPPDPAFPSAIGMRA